MQYYHTQYYTQSFPLSCFPIFSTSLGGFMKLCPHRKKERKKTRNLTEGRIILARARLLVLGSAQTGLGSARLGSSWLGLSSGLPVSAWLHLARPGPAWLHLARPGPAWLCSGLARFSSARLGFGRGRQARGGWEAGMLIL